jgi:hypothetical protein
MTSSTSARSGRAAGRLLKSPLALASDYSRAEEPTASSGSRRTALTDRGVTLAEFEDHLRTANNRDGRPYEEKTINAYVAPAKNLDGWMTAAGIDGDFTCADTALLNRYFREYYLAHGQGGTHTLQRNLIQLFTS